jgi:hypothetical protein
MLGIRIKGALGLGSRSILESEAGKRKQASWEGGGVRDIVPFLWVQDPIKAGRDDVTESHAGSNNKKERIKRDPSPGTDRVQQRVAVGQ